mmetsp:Transcript_182252/g.443547  ORF Transcript_182252/g.443547 Transcript_182252/m.443547 type:complete len:807 (-) Transcript_182252:53-2473(-)
MAENLLADLMGSLLIVAPAAFGIVFAYWLYKKLCKISLFRQSREDDEALLRRMEMADAGEAEADSYQKLRQIYRDIQAGAKAFLAAEYRMCLAFLVVFGVAMIFFVAKVESGWDFKIGTLTAFSFFVGGITSMVSGYIGMMIAVFTNARCTMCATQTPDSLAWKESFNSAFRGGAVMGFALSGLGILVMYFLMCMYVSAFDVAVEAVKLFECIAGFGLGGSAIAMFGRVGGGIYTKAADVGADLAGKVVQGIPEDDPRNPATIADNVGDNVGDVAGMGSDLFGSFAEATCAALVVASASETLVSEGKWPGLMFPVTISAGGILVCLMVSFVATHIKPVKKEADIETVLKLQLGLTTLLLTGAIGLLACMFLPEEFILYRVDATSITFTPLRAWVCTCMGLWSGCLIGFITEYYTSHSYKPVREVSQACETGAATNIIYGLALGYKSAVLPVSLLSIVVYVSFYLGDMYGVSLAALGMLSNLSTCLAIDVYGPICDNAGGIAEMAELPEHVRDVTDALDAAGNTTAAIGKGFAIGSAVLTSLSLLAAFKEQVDMPTGAFDVCDPIVLAGVLIGAMLPFLFGALTMLSVGKAAGAIICEVRRQFREVKNARGVTLMDAIRRASAGEEIPPEEDVQPDSDRCVALATRAAIQEMFAPALFAILAPLIIGFLVGPRCLMGALAGSIVSGCVLAIAMANAGGAWDNAKKLCEKLGVKKDAIGKACVVADTVGDPFKDTSGPALNILIKLMAITALTTGPLLKGSRDWETWRTGVLLLSAAASAVLALWAKGALSWGGGARPQIAAQAAASG